MLEESLLEARTRIVKDVKNGQRISGYGEAPITVVSLEPPGWLWLPEDAANLIKRGTPISYVVVTPLFPCHDLFGDRLVKGSGKIITVCYGEHWWDMDEVDRGFQLESLKG